MKISKRITAVIMSLCLIMTLLSGCTYTAEGKALYDAMNKSKDIRTSQNDMSFTMRFDASGLNEQEQQGLAQLKAMLDGANLTMSVKQSANADQTVAKAQADVKINAAGMAADVGVWVDMDMAGNPLKFNEIIQLPPLFTAADPTLAGKQYVIMDVAKNLNDPGTPAQGADYEDIAKLTREFQAKAAAFMGKYLLQYQPDFRFLTDAGTRDITTPERLVKAHVYQVKLDDKAAKQLLRYTVNNFANNKDATDFMVEYMKFIQRVAAANSGASNPVAGLDGPLADYETAKPALLEKFNKFMDGIENIKLVGDKGIFLEYAVDENGYLISQSGSMDFVIDTAKLSSPEGQEGSGAAASTAVYNLGFDYSFLTYNINKDIAVEIPVTTPENSIHYSDLLKSKLPAQTAEPVQPAVEP